MDFARQVRGKRIGAEKGEHRRRLELAAGHAENPLALGKIGLGAFAQPKRLAARQQRLLHLRAACPALLAVGGAQLEPVGLASQNFNHLAAIDDVINRVAAGRAGVQFDERVGDAHAHRFAGVDRGRFAHHIGVLGRGERGSEGGGEQENETGHQDHLERIQAIIPLFRQALI